MRWLVFFGIGLLLIGGASKVLARNVRNNNPLNIEYSPRNPWKGQIGQDGRFAIFESAAYGFRAAAMLIRKYQREESQGGYGLSTLRAIITRWAPPTENNTAAYVSFVARESGIGADEHINLSANPDKLARVLVAMSKMEGAGDTYTIAEAKSGVMIA